MLEVGQGEFVFRFGVTGDPDPFLTTLGWFHALDMEAHVTEDHAQDAWNAWSGNLKERQSSDLNFIGVDMIYRAAGGTLKASYDQTIACTLAQPMTSQNVAYLVRKNTARIGPGRSGRMYIPGVAESKISPAGFVDGAERTAWNTALIAFLDDMNTMDVDAITVLNHGPTTSTPEPVSIVTSLVMDTLGATQRRRLRGRR